MVPMNNLGTTNGKLNRGLGGNSLAPVSFYTTVHLSNGVLIIYIQLQRTLCRRAVSLPMPLSGCIESPGSSQASETVRTHSVPKKQSEHTCRPGVFHSQDLPGRALSGVCSRRSQNRGIPATGYGAPLCTPRPMPNPVIDQDSMRPCFEPKPGKDALLGSDDSGRGCGEDAESRLRSGQIRGERKSAGR